MPDRITKVTTRAGDAGKTKLATGRTIAKHDPLIGVIGTVDELNSHIGVLLGHAPPDPGQLKSIQQQLFDMGAVFAMEGQYEAPDLTALETATETFNAALPPLTEFVLPGGGPAAAQAHVCRAVCRRAEAQLWGVLDTTGAVDAYQQCARYLNRLSDYFFVLARALTENAEEQWSGPDRG